MRSRIAIALLAAMTSLPSLVAQHVSIMGNFSASSGSLGSRPLSSSPGSMSVTFGQPREPERIFGHRLFPSEFFLGTPLFADYPLADAQRTAAVVNIQTSPATPSGGEGTEPAMSPVAPLLIEWRGDRYVRLSDTTQSASLRGERNLQPDYAETFDTRIKPSGLRRNTADAAPRQLPPAVLVYRDGRQEFVTNYWIGGGAIYVNNDYWTRGSWNRKIELALLDLPLTLRLNQERGVQFLLPSGPNEIVTRP